MKQSVSIPVTIKCRTGIDDKDSEADLVSFIHTVAEAGCETFIIHARKAILQGLSPKQNREVPPLNYERVFRIKETFPELEVVINGGIISLETAEQLLLQVDGVMLGREAYQNPFILHGVDSKFFGGSTKELSRQDYLRQYLPYVESELARGTPLQHMARHILGLFKGQKGGKQYRRHLSEHGHSKDAQINVLLDAISYVN